MAPSVIREGRAPTEAWLPSDRLLSMALTLHEKSMCRGCGSYLDESYDERGKYSVETTVCSGCAALEKHQHDNRDNPVPGEKAWPVNESSAEFSEDEVRPQYG